MQVAYLVFVFLVIIGLLTFHRPLYQAILGGILVACVLFRIPGQAILGRVVLVLTTWSSLSVLLALYLITFLQRILESRSQIKLAQENLNEMFHNRRVNIAGAALFIGLLPSAASMILCSEIVKNATDGILEPDEQAFLASWFRHIPESFLPTYTAVLLMVSLSGITLAQFLLGMLVPVALLAVLGYVTTLRKVPCEIETGKEDYDWKHTEKKGKGKSAIELFCHLWSLLMILVLILAFKMDVVFAVLVSIIGSVIVYRVKWQELKSFSVSAFETKMIGNTFLVLVLKEILSYTGVLQQLPDLMAGLPLPMYLIFALMMFAATVISGSTAAIAMGVPLAFAAIPGGVPLAVYLMSVTHAASQISPTHVCLVVASEYFHVPLGKLVRRTLPVSIAVFVLMTLYYQLMIML